MRVFIAEKRYLRVNQVKMNLRLCHSEDPLAGMGGWVVYKLSPLHKELIGQGC